MNQAKLWQVAVISFDSSDCSRGSKQAVLIIASSFIVLLICKVSIEM